MKRFLAELRRRKVLHTAAIYGALAWGAIEVVTTVFPAVNAPAWAVTAVVVAILTAFPLAVGLSWMLDITPDGLRRTFGQGEVDASPAVPSGEPRIGASPLPPQPNALVGRDEEVEKIAGLLRSDARIATITGPGGAGKTRVSIAAAEAARASFDDGVAFISLASITEPEQVIPEIAQTLDIREVEGRSLRDGIETLMGGKRFLLVLDNFEHVLGAASAIAELAAACENLRVLVTSRARLRVSTEREFALAPLAVPPPGDEPAPEDIEIYPAVRLFMDRAREVRPDLRLGPDDIEAVVEICRRLDGLPLALELAAARTRVLSPAALLDRLGRALDVLTTGARDLPARQRTLRATIDWSHSLLDAGEQRLFRRLAVFAGGWTQSALEAVCYDGDAGARALDEAASLVEKGLAQAAPEPGRFMMLETIREYARERLENSGEPALLRARHAAHFLDFADEADAAIREERQAEWVERVGREDANVRDAIEWLTDRALEGDGRAAEDGMRLCGALWFHWHIRGHHTRTRAWVRPLLDAPAGPERSIGRVRALRAAGLASWSLGERERSIDEFRTSHGMAEALGEESDAARSAFPLGATFLTMGRLESAREWLEKAVERSRALGEAWALGWSLLFLGMTEAASGNVDRAAELFGEALEIQRRIGDRHGKGLTLSGLADLAFRSGEPERALGLYREALQVAREEGDRVEAARLYEALGTTTLALGRPREARAHFRAGLQTYHEIGSERGVGLALTGFAATAAIEGEPERAVRLAAAAETLSEAEGMANVFAEDSPLTRYIDDARATVDEDARRRLEAEGRRLSVAEAIAYAAGPRDTATDPVPAPA